MFFVAVLPMMGAFTGAFSLQKSFQVVRALVTRCRTRSAERAVQKHPPLRSNPPPRSGSSNPACSCCRAAIDSAAAHVICNMALLCPPFRSPWVASPLKVPLCWRPERACSPAEALLAECGLRPGVSCWGVLWVRRKAWGSAAGCWEVISTTSSAQPFFPLMLRPLRPQGRCQKRNGQTIRGR